jgi:hypothetical protein
MLIIRVYYPSTLFPNFRFLIVAPTYLISGVLSKQPEGHKLAFILGPTELVPETGGTSMAGK